MTMYPGYIKTISVRAAWYIKNALLRVMDGCMDGWMRVTGEQTRALQGAELAHAIALVVGQRRPWRPAVAVVDVMCCAALEDGSNRGTRVTRRCRDAGRSMRADEAAGTPVRIYPLHSVGSRRPVRADPPKRVRRARGRGLR